MSCCCHSKPAPVPGETPSVEEPSPPTPSAAPQKSAEWAVLGLLILMAGLSMNVSLAVNVSELSGSTRLAVHGALAAAGAAAILLGGRDLFRPAWRALRERRIVTEHLFLAGILAAWAVSVHATLTGSGAVFYEVPILLPAIRRFGAILLRRQSSGLREAAEELLAGITTARARRGGAWELIPLSTLSAGEEILVRAGETIPADGIITEGRAYVQVQSLTGEPLPASLQEGAAVSAGTVSLDGDLAVRVGQAPAASELSRIAVSTQALLAQPPAYLRSVEKVLAWFFPAVLTASLGTCLFWAWHSGWHAAIAHSLAVVLVACPCAFGVALPLLFRRGLAACLRRGITPADGAFMESLAMVKMVAFDKTGTLTELDMGVEALLCAPGVAEDRVRAILAALHRSSSHPVARPFWPWTAEAQDVAVQNLRLLPGQGIEAEVQWKTEAGRGHQVRLGHEALFCPASTALPAWADAASGRRLFLEIDGSLTAVCQLSEQLRPSAASACARLAAQGYRLALLTGDATVPAGLAAADFHETRTALRPADKAAQVEQWEREGLPVLFLGDGLNDASALASATAGIAVGESPRLTAASARAHWHNPDFASLPELCRSARALSARARLILRTSLAYNTLGMAIAACGLLHPAAATVVMLLSSATVTALATKGGRRIHRPANSRPEEEAEGKFSALPQPKSSFATAAAHS